MEETEETGRVRRLATNFGLFLIVTFVTLCIAELIVRVWTAGKINMMPRYHTDAQYDEFTLRRLRPNSRFWHKSRDGAWEFVTNSQGFRNYDDFEYQKAPGQVRVLALGDSQTQGYEVRQGQTYASVIERYLRRENISVEVINAGVSGFSTAEALIFLENEGIKYQPDIVVLGFFANDLEDNVKAGLFRLDEFSNLVVAKKEHIPGVRVQNLIYSIPGTQWLGENSHLYSFAFNTAWRYFKTKVKGENPKKAFDYQVATQQTFSDYQIELASKLLMRMSEFCKAKGVSLIVIDIPWSKRGKYPLSSMPSAVQRTAIESSDAFIESTSLLSEYAFATDLFVHSHVSEFTHAMLGVAAGRESKEMLAANQVTSPLQTSPDVER